MTNERLQELRKYVQSIRNNGWISFAKSDDLISLIDSAMKPVYVGGKNCNECAELSGCPFKYTKPEVGDGSCSMFSAMKPGFRECKHKGVDGKCRLTECAPDYIEYCVDGPCPNYADSAMQPASAECERAIENISARYAKTLEEGKANSLAIQALKQYQGGVVCENT